MIYIIGDCHGNFERFNASIFPEQNEMTKDDYDLYKKCFAKIKRLLTSKVICYKNCFKDIYLLHPCDVKLNDEYILYE